MYILVHLEFSALSIYHDRRETKNTVQRKTNITEGVNNMHSALYPSIKLSKISWSWDYYDGCSVLLDLSPAVEVIAEWDTLGGTIK